MKRRLDGHTSFYCTRLELNLLIIWKLAPLAYDSISNMMDSEDCPVFTKNSGHLVEFQVVGLQKCLHIVSPARVTIKNKECIVNN